MLVDGDRDLRDKNRCEKRVACDPSALVEARVVPAREIANRRREATPERPKPRVYNNIMFDERTIDSEWTGVYELTVADEDGYERVETHERFVNGGGELRDRVLNEATLIERRLLGYVIARSKLDAAEAFDLSRAYDLKLHRLRGCASFFEYMERVLHYAPHTARERLRVSRALVGLPVMSAALSQGELAYSHVRELTRVATCDTERVWLGAIEHRNSTDVQAMVAGRALGDLPTDPQRRDLKPKRMALELPPDVMALWREARKALADERGSSDVTDVALLETLCRRFLNPGSEEGPPQRLAIWSVPSAATASRSVPVASSMSRITSWSALAAMRGSSAT